MFAVETMTRQEQRQILRGQCHSTSRTIMQCLQNKVKTPRDSNPIDSKLNKLDKVLMLHGLKAGVKIVIFQPKSHL